MQLGRFRTDGRPELTAGDEMTSTSEGDRQRLLPTGFRDLDRIRVLDGSGPLLISGLPGTGSTALGLDIARHVCSVEQEGVVYVSDHLAERQLEARVLTAGSRLTAPGVRDPGIAAERRREQQEALHRTAGWPLTLVSAPAGVTPGRIVELLDHVRSTTGPVRLLIVDRSSALRPPLGSAASNVDVVATLHDVLEPRDVQLVLTERPAAEMWPKLARHRVQPYVGDSASFAALAEILGAAMILHRPELYHEHAPERGVGEMHLVWQRFGHPGVIHAAFLPHLGSWRDLPSPPRVARAEGAA